MAEGYLSVEDLTFKRGSDKQLLPVDLEIKTLERKKLVDKIEQDPETGEDIIAGKELVVTQKAPKIKVLPAPRGKWLEILAMKPPEQDREILFNHVLEPKIDEEVYAAMKPGFASAIITDFTLLVLDISQDEKNSKKSKEELTEAEEFEYQKNLKGGKDVSPSSSTNSDTTSSQSPNLPIEK